jgi:hypothetical protein
VDVPWRRYYDASGRAPMTTALPPPLRKRSLERSPPSPGRAVLRRFPTLLLLPLLPLYVLPLLAVYLAIPVFHPGPGPGLVGDEGSFLGFAHNLLHGYYATSQSKPGWNSLPKGPGLPLVLAPLVALHLPVLVLRFVVGPLTLFLAVVAFFKLANIYLRHDVALVVAYLFGCAYLPFFTLPGRIADEPLTILLTVLIAHRVATWHRTRRTKDLALTGFLLGALALTKVEFGYLLVLWILTSGVLSLLLRKDRASARFALVACLLGMAVCVPYLVYTYSYAHRIFYWSDSGGSQLYWMTSRQSGDLGDWHNWTTVFTDPHLAPHRQFFRSLEHMSSVEKDSALQATALHNITDDPLRYGRNLVFNAERQVFNTPYSYTPTRWASIIGFGIPAGFVILLFLWSVLRMFRRKRLRRPEMTMFVVFVVTTFGLHTVVSAYGRMFVTVVAMAVVVSAYALLHERFGISKVGNSDSVAGESLSGTGMRMPVQQRRRGR